MSSPSKPPSPIVPIESQAKLLSAVALGALIVGPIVIALPPRKFDFYTIALLGGTFMGGNQVCYEYTGRSITKRFKDRVTDFGELPEKAKIAKVRLQAEKEQKALRDLRYEDSLRGKLAGSEPEPQSAVLAEIQKKTAEDVEGEEERNRRLIDRVWLGGEDKNWKEKRDQREREYLEDGRGYGALIIDQIWEVWTWGKDKTEEIKKQDEEVLEQRKKDADKNQKG